VRRVSSSGSRYDRAWVHMDVDRGVPGSGPRAARGADPPEGWPRQGWAALRAWLEPLARARARGEHGFDEGVGAGASQEALLRLWLRMQAGGRITRPRRWLRKVLHDLLVDQVRRRAARRTGPAVGPTQDGTHQADDLALPVPRDRPPPVRPSLDARGDHPLAPSLAPRRPRTRPPALARDPCDAARPGPRSGTKVAVARTLRHAQKPVAGYPPSPPATALEHPPKERTR
jgi:DNA-directed RNA polymerase specialized sigma24 family protein